MLNINALLIEISSLLIRVITGKLFTDEQIKTITSNAIGRYFSEWLPQPENELQAQIRVEKAKEHISKNKLEKRRKLCIINS